MKRIFSAVFLLISLWLLIISTSQTTNCNSYSDYRISESVVETLKNSRLKTDRELLQEISFNNIPAPYDKLTGRWFYSVNAEKSDIDPGIRFFAPDKNIRIAFSGNIKPGTESKLIAYNQTEYKEYTLAVTSLPLIKIDCGADLFAQMDNWKEIRMNNLPKEPLPMKFTIYDNRPEALQPVTISEGTIHIRGASTLSFPKKSFRLKLLEKSVGKEQKEYQTSLLGMRQDGDWLLYAPYNDQEKIRNVFSSNLWFDSCADDNSFGLKNGMEYRYVELFLNQQYWGLYALGYPVDAKQMGIRSDNQGHYEEFLFKQKAFGPDYTDLENGTHGYILQFDADESDLNNGLMIMKMYFSQLFSESPNALWHNDLNNAIDIWLFLKLGQAFDTVIYRNQLKNILYTIKKTDKGRKILFTPWDADNYWGNAWSDMGKNKTNEYALNADDNSLEMTVNPVSYLIEKDQSIIDLIQKKYSKLRADSWSNQTISNMLDRFEQDIYGSGAYIRDAERWPDANYQDPRLSLSVFRNYVLARLHSMDNFITGLHINDIQ